MNKFASIQRGVTLSGLLVWLVVLILAAIIGMKLIPAYIENAQINNIFNAIVRDPEMSGAPIKNVRDSYFKRATIDSITVLDPSEVEIVTSGSGVSLSASYQVIVPLVANISLMLEFNPSSSSR